MPDSAPRNDVGVDSLCSTRVYANQPPKCNSAAPVRYTWDGGTLDTPRGSAAPERECVRGESRENRLKAVEPMTPVNDVSRKAEFAYDYLPLTRVRRSLGVASRHVPHGGTWRVKDWRRRVQKKVYNRTSGAWVLASDERFVYDGPALDTPGHGASQGWNVVMVLDGRDGEYPGTEPDNVTVRKYTWGLDLSGLAGQSPERKRAGGIHGAGGTLDTRSSRQGQVGGLLAVEETTGTHQGSYWFFYRIIGTVTYYIDSVWMVW